MTPAEFRQWKSVLGLSGADVVRLLGIAPNTVTKYQKDGADIPAYIALACAAVARGLKPWPQ